MKLNRKELQIIEARDNGAISQYEKENLRNEIDTMIPRFSAISGCNLPNTSFFSWFVTDEIMIFLRDFGYSDYSLQEVLLAFRFNSEGGNKYPNGEEVEQIRFTGSCINVDYLSKIMLNYKQMRDLLDKKIKNKIDGYEL